jgi:hypothetical protein
VICGWVRKIRTPLRTRYALRFHTLLGTSRYGRHWHDLLFKIGLRSPRRPTFEVNAAFEVPPSGVSRPTCSCMFERLTWRRGGNRGKDLRFSGF